MVTILAPTDFSLNASHATTYAAQLLAKQFHNEGRLILLHVFEAPSPVSEYELNMLHFDTMKTYIRERLEERKEQIKQDVDHQLKIECIATNEGLIDHIRKVSAQAGVDFIVIGLTGAGMGNIFLGSHTLEIVRRAGYPVVTVPPRADFPIQQGIRRIVFACDMIDVRRTIPFDRIRNIAELFQAEIQVLYVRPTRQEEEAQLRKELDWINSQLAGVPMSFHELVSRQVVSGIKDFVKEQHADMILMIPRAHHGLESLLKVRHTRAMLFRSSVPVLTIPPATTE
ncbi:MAG: universal stress protein [Thermoflavifilum sp.]|nr:universal stress protein [Thermoflavifilum sp.]